MQKNMKEKYTSQYYIVNLIHLKKTKQNKNKTKKKKKKKKNQYLVLYQRIVPQITVPVVLVSRNLINSRDKLFWCINFTLGINNMEIPSHRYASLETWNEKYQLTTVDRNRAA